MIVANIQSTINQHRAGAGFLTLVRRHIARNGVAAFCADDDCAFLHAHTARLQRTTLRNKAVYNISARRSG